MSNTNQLWGLLWGVLVFGELLGGTRALYTQVIGGSIVMGMGMYAQHAGGTDEQRYSHTTTFLSHFFNLTMFNAGFHVEHHEHPAVHWSELPRLHEEMKPELIAGGAGSSDIAGESAGVL